jgi:hypothetical protein
MAFWGSHSVELTAENEPRDGGDEDVEIEEATARNRVGRAVAAVADCLRRHRLRRLPPLEPIRLVTSRLRLSPRGVVHRGDLDTGQGITTACGGYALHGRYDLTEDPVTCRRCSGWLARRESRDDEARQDAWPL